MADPPTPTRRRDEPLWLEPYPDALLAALPDSAPGPEARYEIKEAVSLAFVTAVQNLAPQQRAVLVLRDVLGFRSAEVANMLETSDAAVKGALQRARAAVEERVPSDAARPSLSPDEEEVVDRFARAVESGDVDGVVTLLADDAWLTMPPQPFEYQGHAAIAGFLRDRAVRRGRPLRVVPIRANGQPGLACYLPDDSGVARTYGSMVLSLAGGRIAAITWFGEASVFERFGLPAVLEAT
jgi:RNA polymerase sigma-70 factor (ECF subfamily)